MGSNANKIIRLLHRIRKYDLCNGKKEIKVFKSDDHIFKGDVVVV